MEQFKPEFKPPHVVVMADGTKTPVPPGYTPERVVEILRGTGHEPVSVEDANGKAKAA